MMDMYCTRQTNVAFYIECFTYNLVEKKDIQKEALKPVNKIKSEEDKN